MAQGTIGLKLVIAIVSMAAITVESRAQTSPGGDTNEARIEDLITASHILANEGVLDSFGHATVRSATDPGHFFMPRAMPLFEVSDGYGSATERGMLVLNSALGKALATKLGNNPVVLMRGHGETVVGRSVKEATVRTLYINIDARAQAAAASMGPNLVVLDDAELATNARENFDADRPWENYRQRMLKAQAQQR